MTGGSFRWLQRCGRSLDKRRWLAGLTAATLAIGVAGCGLYGERGFFDDGTLSKQDFIDAADEHCSEHNEGLDRSSAELLITGGLEGESAEDYVDALRDDIRDLVDDLVELKGPEQFERARDSLTDALANAADQLGEVQDALDAEDSAGASGLLGAIRQRLSNVEPAARAAGFNVCGSFQPPA